jgi:undecaprenyl-phosphate 4-deoxy-4-formamido-L-arabinose transferase
MQPVQGKRMNEKSKKSVSLIIAAYNEENILRDSLQYAVECLDAVFEDYELILVDDGSTDKTGEIMDAFAKEYNYVSVLHNLINLNFGASVQRGIAASTKEYITYNAADLPLDPKTTRSMVDMMEEEDADLLVAQRVRYLGTSAWRRFVSLVNRAFLAALFPKGKRGIRDTNNVQMYKRSMVKRIMPFATGPVFTWPEMIFRARYTGLKVIAPFFEYRPRFERAGAFGKPHDIIWGIYEMLRFRIRLWTGKI